MTAARMAVVFLVALALGAGAGGSSHAAGVVPTGLHGFLLRADEPARDSFSRTPAFGWNPVPGAIEYQFQLSMSSTFRQSGLVFEQDKLTSPVAAPALTLPWITGSPYALYARVRAVVSSAGVTSTTDWSADFGFNMVPPAPPKPLPSSPGVLRWSPTDGADGYEVWLIDVNGGKKEQVFSNVLDEREFYTFHQSPKWVGTVRWRIRALRNTVDGPVNGVKPVQFGAWSPIYVSSNPDPALSTGPIQLAGTLATGGGTLSDVFSTGDPASPAHRLMPAFTWTGNQAGDGTTAELFRVYVFTDKQCINPVFTSAIVGSPSYAPRPHGPLSLPTASVAAARAIYIPDGAEPSSLAYDGSGVVATESGQDASAAAPSDGSAGSVAGASSSSVVPAIDGAPIDLWDVNWPEGGYYWTVIPVAATNPGALLTNVVTPGGPATATSLPVSNSNGFAAGDSVTVGSGANSEPATITGVTDKSLTFASALKYNHGAGEPINRTGGSLRYQDLEMPQDVCAAGRVARFGKESEPALTASGTLFASGLSNTNTGRLTSALHTAAFYKAPLVSWTPALGADQYEIQWSKTARPFDAATGGDQKLYSTSFVLPITTGTWYYRVRGFDRSQPGAQGMSWSDPATITVTKATFTIVPTPAAKPKSKKKP